MRHISTAPPGVTAFPAAAMRTGHMTFAFLHPQLSAMPVIAASMLSSFQSGSASNTGSIFRSISREPASSVLLFLWMYSAVSYPGSSSKKSSFSGMSVSTSVRCCKSAAMAAGSIRGFFTALRMKGSAAFAKASGLMARIYSALKYLSFSISNIAGDLEMPLMSKISAISRMVYISRSPPGLQPSSAT